MGPSVLRISGGATSFWVILDLMRSCSRDMYDREWWVRTRFNGGSGGPENPRVYAYMPRSDDGKTRLENGQLFREKIPVSFSEVGIDIEAPVPWKPWWVPLTFCNIIHGALPR